jgi:hypothetical protein
MRRSGSMKRLAVVALAACSGDPKPPVEAPTPNPVVARPAMAALPSDGELGELAIAPLPKRDLGSWIPQGTVPILVEHGLREGKGPAPSWLAIDAAGAETRLTYGARVQLPYGCDNGQLSATTLDGARAKLAPGLLWLRSTSHAAWAPMPVKVVEVPGATADRRAYQVGDGRIELVRQQPTRGVATITWKRARQALPFERSDMEGADNKTPMDLSNPGVAQPVPEAAWSFAAGEAVLIVFRVPGYEGVQFKAVVLGFATAREVATMGPYLYHCAF